MVASFPGWWFDSGSFTFVNAPGFESVNPVLIGLAVLLLVTIGALFAIADRRRRSRQRKPGSRPMARRTRPRFSIVTG